ncbi:hypothetical protein SAMN05444392_11171 [Seinonella peptonophila]|uniref:Uncharacterized protein n=1 Tax=Seinonella peptonophila TaxID=112248 RepID=A0A1M4ZZQ1_9BACL|nr:hypothetical protein [Seinonella peptonophila]SHF23530.1 hypothetical protein SAMN05444392_11171 [Seinonella peptonophila]
MASKKRLLKIPLIRMGREVKGRCKICGEEALIWTDGGKLVCTACDSPQW